MVLSRTYSKIIGMHPEERAMVGSTFSFSDSQLTVAVLIIGALEVLFGLLWLCTPRKRQLFALQLILFPMLTIAAVIAVPSTVIHPFNPVTFNLALMVLSTIGFSVSQDVPSAKSCKRER